VLQEKANEQDHKSIFTRMCRNPECGVVFFTSESLVRVLPNVPVDELTRQIGSLGPRKRKELQAFLDKLSKQDAGKE
jgi:hypothetical protein